MEREKLSPEKHPNREQLPANVVEIERPEAVYRIIYGRHDREQESEDLGDIGALVLETGNEDYSTREKAESTLAVCSELIQYRKVVTAAERKKLPIFLVDVTDAETASILRDGVRNIETRIGAVATLGILASLISSKEKMDRRTFIKYLAGALGVGYLTSHVWIDNIHAVFGEKMLNEKNASRKVARILEDVQEKIHPETEKIIITLRNYLIAQKTIAVAKELSLSDIKPKIGIVVGASHHGVEKALKEEDAKRIEVIKNLLSAPEIRGASSHAALIVRLDFDGELDKWETTDIFQDPAIAGKLNKCDLLGGGGSMSGGY